MDRKEEIIYATLELASEYGLRAVSMQQIADKVGIRKASVYNHFKSREEIVEAMYQFLRQKSSEANGVQDFDMEDLLNSYSLKQILMMVVGNYQKMSTAPEMYMFYKITMSERSLDKSAAEIMVTETKKMIQATTVLFYALQAKKLVNIQNIESAAMAFAMGIHSIIDYECDIKQIGQTDDKNLLEKYIDEFCYMYGSKEE